MKAIQFRLHVFFFPYFTTSLLYYSTTLLFYCSTHLVNIMFISLGEKIMGEGGFGYNFAVVLREERGTSSS